MSRLGDLIIEHGPYTPYELVPLAVERFIESDQLNALRDELIKLRAAAAPPAQQCPEDTYSWDHFTAEQVDAYWIRCTLHGAHDEHKDEHTGLTWSTQTTRSTETPSSDQEGGPTRA